MTNPEHGHALSDSATDYFKWLDGDGIIKPFICPASSNPASSPPSYIWYSVAQDVRGKPDITIQVSADTLAAENVFPIAIETSLDGSHWNTVPEALMQIDPPGLITIQNNVAVLLLLFLRTNYIRLLIKTNNAAPWPTGNIIAAIVAGEA
jgi:hypothetical protein